MRGHLNEPVSGSDKQETQLKCYRGCLSASGKFVKAAFSQKCDISGKLKRAVDGSVA